MHIPDGILPAEVVAAGYLTTGALTWYALRKGRQEEDDPYATLPRVSLMSAAFFVASWIHIPLPPASVHLVLNGLMGVVLGYYAIPAIVVGLFFQAVMFQHGGLTTLGVNAAVMGLPALLAYHLSRWRFGLRGPYWEGLFAFLGGGIGLGVGALLAFYLLFNTIPAHLDANTERAALYGLLVAHIPLMFIEGLFTAFVVHFLKRVEPTMVSSYATQN